MSRGRRSLVPNVFLQYSDPIPEGQKSRDYICEIRTSIQSDYGARAIDDRPVLHSPYATSKVCILVCSDRSSS